MKMQLSVIKRTSFGTSCTFKNAQQNTNFYYYKKYTVLITTYSVPTDLKVVFYLFAGIDIKDSIFAPLF